jgi:hypothetical protein
LVFIPVAPPHVYEVSLEIGYGLPNIKVIIRLFFVLVMPVMSLAFGITIAKPALSVAYIGY